MIKPLLIPLFVLASVWGQAHEVNNGAIEGVYDVSTTEMPLSQDLKSIIKNSQLPASVKDPLEKELFSSPYLKADKDVKFTGAKFSGDWYVGEQDKLFYARTMPFFGSATTIFPVFYKLPKEKQEEILIHEAIHRLEFLKPNNISEDFVVATTSLIIEDAKISFSGDSVKKLVSAAKIKAWFDATLTRSNIPMNKLHWVGAVTLLHHETIKADGGYTQTLLSIYPGKWRNDSDYKWYAEVGIAKYLFSEPNQRVKPFEDDINYLNSNTPTEFLKTLTFKAEIGPYLFVGNAQSVLDPLRGQVFEKTTKVYVGEFVLHPLHDGGTGASLPITKPQCRVVSYPAADPSCYGK